MSNPADFMRHHLILAAALALLAASCDKNNSPEPSGSDREIKVSPAVAGVTRAYYTTEALGDFDLFVVNPRNSRYSYTNTRFTKNAGGQWLPASQMLWEKPAGKPQNVSLLALSPALETGGHSLADSPILNVEVEKRQSAESRKSDLLYFFLNDDDSSWQNRFNDNGELTIGFSHAMSLFTIELTLGTEFNHGGVPETNPVTDLKVEGTVLKGVFQAEGDGYAVKASATDQAETVYPYETEWTKATDGNGRCKAKYECILIPQTVGQLTVSFLVNGIPYKWTAADASFRMGMSRNLPLTVGKDEVVVGEVTVSPWSDGGENDIETE